MLRQAGVVRVDVVTGDETDAPDVKPWDLAVVSPLGARRLLEVYNACDGVALHAILGSGTRPSTPGGRSRAIR